MHHPRRFLLLLFVLAAASACINVPEVEPTPNEPEADAGSTPDAGEEELPPPTLRTTFPAGGSTQVDTDTQLVLTFSSAVDTNSLRLDVAPHVAMGPIEWSNQGTTAVTRPSTALAQNTAYTVTVEAKDRTGQSLTGTRSFTFTTTGPAPDTTPPTILNTTPGQAAIGVPRDPVIEVLFSEPMDRTSVQNAFAITSPAGQNSGSFNWNEADTVMTYALPSIVTYGTTITWQLSTLAKDKSGNTLQEAGHSEFRIVRQASMTMPIIYSVSGSISTSDTPDFHYRSYATYVLERIGDNSANQSSRLFFGFKLDALPSELIQINRSTIKWWLSTQLGQPFEQLGPLLLEPVDVGEYLPQSNVEDTESPVLTAAYNAQPRALGLTLTAANIGTPGQFDVTSYVTQDWASRVERNYRSQFRLRFTRETNSDRNTDELRSSSSTYPTLAELEVVYEYP
ncbi:MULTISPECIES: Ig-like domain-containing protein [Myxococcus]|uniref:Ig-like domain-containing protein n=1 Tax=Myxococcus TaxID=32 RepID=UPI001E4FFD42|nr:MULTISPECIES: Ig-like domain-containing protein [Myxococcus]